MPDIGGASVELVDFTNGGTVTLDLGQNGGQSWVLGEVRFFLGKLTKPGRSKDQRFLQVLQEFVFF